MMDRDEAVGLPWRVGRKVKRTIYAILGDEPSDVDELIGLMDTPLLAASAVMAHNHLLIQSNGVRRWCGNEQRHPEHGSCPGLR